jgi:hypothetical protein
MLSAERSPFRPWDRALAAPTCPAGVRVGGRMPCRESPTPERMTLGIEPARHVASPPEMLCANRRC